MKTRAGLLFLILSAILTIVFTLLSFAFLFYLDVPLFFDLLISANVLVCSILLIIKRHIKHVGKYNLPD